MSSWGCRYGPLRVAPAEDEHHRRPARAGGTTLGGASELTRLLQPDLDREPSRASRSVRDGGRAASLPLPRYVPRGRSRARTTPRARRPSRVGIREGGVRGLGATRRAGTAGPRAPAGTPPKPCWAASADDVAHPGGRRATLPELEPRPSPGPCSVTTYAEPPEPGSVQPRRRLLVLAAGWDPGSRGRAHGSAVRSRPGTAGGPPRSPGS